jgi:hypothetical protein
MPESTRTLQEVLPPCTDRGVERITVRPDWLDVTFRPEVDADHLGVAHELLQRYAPGPSTVGRGRGFYDHLLHSDDTGASVAYGGRADATGTVLLNLPGKYWGSQGDPDGLVRALYERDGHVARFDLAADYTGDGVPTVGDLSAAIVRREWATRLRSAYEGRDLISGTRTVYLGSKSSDRRVRIYDARGPVRVEVQCRNEVAGRLLESVALSGSGTAHSAAVASVVDFPTVPGWAAMLGAA